MFVLSCTEQGRQAWAGLSCHAQDGVAEASFQKGGAERCRAVEGRFNPQSQPGFELLNIGIMGYYCILQNTNIV